ncbi:MFS general substrate transporter [Serendipita vermifera]|nr:MFS general substrate transporter [Serendipita vermifera]
MEADQKTQWKTQGDALNPLETPNEKKTGVDTPGNSEKYSAKELDQVVDADNEHDAFARQDVSWSADEERALVRRLDFRIVPLVTVLYLCNFIDRANIGNAKVAGLTTDLGLVGYQYNIGLSVFYIAYIFVEVPSNLLLKRFGAKIWLSFLVLCFGVVCFCTAFITNFTEFMVIRVLLGIAEGGMMPGVAYYLSTWYKRDELALRIGIFVSAASLSGAFGGLLATGLLSIPQLKHLPHGQWRNIFLVEGAITILFALIGYWLLPRSPDHSGFLTERERMIAMERVRVENAGLVEEETTEWDLVLRAWFSMTNWICAAGFFLTNISIQGMVLFMPSLIAGMGYDAIKAQLLTVPPYILASFWSITLSYMAQRSSKRGIWILSSVPLSIIGSAMLIGSENRNVGYAGIFLLATGGEYDQLANVGVRLLKVDKQHSL